jgi:hypothetical protein
VLRRKDKASLDATRYWETHVQIPGPDVAIASGLKQWLGRVGRITGPDWNAGWILQPHHQVVRITVGHRVWLYENDKLISAARRVLGIGQPETT